MKHLLALTLFLAACAPEKVNGLTFEQREAICTVEIRERFKENTGIDPTYVGRCVPSGSGLRWVTCEVHFEVSSWKSRVSYWVCQP